MNINEIKQQLESILFVASKAVSINELTKILGVDKKEVEKIGDKLFDEYKEGRGMQIIKHDNKFQMLTSKDNTDIVQTFLKDSVSGDLSQPSLETLAVIAYRGPVLKTEIERIRGVNCTLILRNLMLRGLIVAKKENKSDELYYNVSFDFLRFLGISDIKNLPNYEKLAGDEFILT